MVPTNGPDDKPAWELAGIVRKPSSGRWDFRRAGPEEGWVRYGQVEEDNRAVRGVPYAARPMKARLVVQNLHRERCRER